MFYIKQNCYYQRNKEKLREQAPERYHNGGGKEKAIQVFQNEKEMLQKSAQNKHTEIFEEMRVKRAYVRERHRNVSEKEKLKLQYYKKEYRNLINWRLLKNKFDVLNI